MNTALGILLVVEWVLIIVGGIAFLISFGWPGRARDSVMAWHLVLVTVVAVAEPVGLLLAGLSLIPAVVVYTLSTVIVYWRVALLIQARHRARERPRG